VCVCVFVRERTMILLPPLSECVCVCVRERERERVFCLCVRELRLGCMCVRELSLLCVRELRPFYHLCVCAHVYERERERDSLSVCERATTLLPPLRVCVCVCVEERESLFVCERALTGSYMSHTYI